MVVVSASDGEGVSMEVSMGEKGLCSGDNNGNGGMRYSPSRLPLVCHSSCLISTWCESLEAMTNVWSPNIVPNIVDRDKIIL